LQGIPVLREKFLDTENFHPQEALNFPVC
jgi:hypothetical protein